MISTHAACSHVAEVELHTLVNGACEIDDFRNLKFNAVFHFYTSSIKITVKDMAIHVIAVPITNCKIKETHILTFCSPYWHICYLLLNVQVKI